MADYAGELKKFFVSTTWGDSSHEDDEARLFFASLCIYCARGVMSIGFLDRESDGFLDTGSMVFLGTSSGLRS
ncbi:hypothetical protein BJP07_01040 [Corynebacterium sp. NML130628]|nr:hypothetical protein BJP07_01040 [Corynebacterium sp. NML130628]